MITIYYLFIYHIFEGGTAGCAGGGGQCNCTSTRSGASDGGLLTIKDDLPVGLVWLPRVEITDGWTTPGDVRCLNVGPLQCYCQYLTYKMLSPGSGTTRVAQFSKGWFHDRQLIGVGETHPKLLGFIFGDDTKGTWGSCVPQCPPLAR